MSATRYYVCQRGHDIATPHVLTHCPLAICETPLRQTGGTGLRSAAKATEQIDPAFEPIEEC